MSERSSFNPELNQVQQYHRFPEGELHHSASEVGVIRTPNLSLFVSRRLISELLPHESTCHLIARRSLQVFGPLIACAAKLSFIALSVAAAGSNEVLAGFLSYGNVTAFSIVISWCALCMIRDLMAPKGDEVQALESSQASGWRKTTVAIISIAFGILAQFPLAYLVYVYNNNNLLMPIAVMVSDPWFPVYSTWMGLNKLFAKCGYSPFEKELLASKEEFTGRLREFQQQLNYMDASQRSSYRSGLTAIAEDVLNQNPAWAYVKKMNERKVDNIPRPSPMYRGLEYIIFGFGLVYLISQYMVIGRTGFAGWKLIEDQPIFDYIMTGPIIASYFYITGKSIPDAAVRLFGLASSLVCCNYQPTLAQRIMPKLGITLTLFTLFTTFLAWGPNKEISTDYFNGGLKYFMLATAPAAVVLLTTSILLMVMDILLEHYIEKRGTADEKEDIKLKWKYDELCRVLDTCSPSDFAKFLKEVPEEDLDLISSNAEDIVQRLDKYLSQPLRESSSLLIQEGQEGGWEMSDDLLLDPNSRV